MYAELERMRQQLEQLTPLEDAEAAANGHQGPKDGNEADASKYDYMEDQQDAKELESIDAEIAALDAQIKVIV